MGEIKGFYNAEFPVGSIVRIAGREQLELFLREWRFHHPLEPDQVQYAGRVARVTNVSFYHGGDQLYELLEVPGIWHEQCLSLEESL